MNIIFANRKDAGTRSNTIGPGLPWRTSLIHKIGCSKGCPTAKKIQKLKASQNSAGSATLSFITEKFVKNSDHAPAWTATPIAPHTAAAKLSEPSEMLRLDRKFPEGDADDVDDEITFSISSTKA